MEVLLANVAAMKLCLQRSTGEFFSSDPRALVFIFHPQSPGGQQNPETPTLPHAYHDAQTLVVTFLRMLHATGREKFWI